MNELMDLPIFHDQRSSDKQIQIKTMHRYYSAHGIQRHKSESCDIQKSGLAVERSSDLRATSSRRHRVFVPDVPASDSAHLKSAD